MRTICTLEMVPQLKLFINHLTEFLTVSEQHLEGVDLCPYQPVKGPAGHEGERKAILLGNQNSFHSLDTEEVGEKFSL